MAYISSENIKEIWHRKNGLWHKIGEAFHSENGIFKKVFAGELSLMPPYPATVNFEKGAVYGDSTVRFDDADIYIHSKRGNSANVVSKEDIDFSLYSKLIIEHNTYNGSVAGGNTTIHFGDVDKIGIAQTGGQIIQTIDISAYNDIGKLRFSASSVGTGELDSHRYWLIYSVKFIS